VAFVNSALKRMPNCAFCCSIAQPVLAIYSRSSDDLTPCVQDALAMLVWDKEVSATASASVVVDRRETRIASGEVRCAILRGPKGLHDLGTRT